MYTRELEILTLAIISDREKSDRTIGVEKIGGLKISIRNLTFNPRTTGGGYPPPRRFFVDNAPRNLACLFLHHFYMLCASCDFLTWKIRSPGQFEWPNLNHLFATLRQCQSQTRWASALKAAGYNKPIRTYNLNISTFLIKIKVTYQLVFNYNVNFTILRL